MIEKIKTLLLAADEKRRQYELAASLGDSVSAKVLKEEVEGLERLALVLVREQCGLL